MGFSATKHFTQSKPNQNDNPEKKSDCEASGLKDFYKILLQSDRSSFLDNLKFVAQVTAIFLAFEAITAAEKVEKTVDKEVEKAKNLCNQLSNEMQSVVSKAYQSLNFWSSSKKEVVTNRYDSETPSNNNKATSDQSAAAQTNIASTPALK